MTLFKPEPFSSEVNRLFNTLFTGGEERSERWLPAMDLVEAEDHFLLKADLPGMSEEDVSLEIQDNTLTVSGERRAEHEQREQGWYRVERSFGRFSRSLTLPQGVNPEAVTASFDRGVLTIRIPKPEERRPRRVTISTGGERREQPAVEGTATERPAEQVGQPAPVAGGEQDQPQGPGIAPDAPPVEDPGEGQRHHHPAEGPSHPAAAPQQTEVAAGEAGGSHPMQPETPSADEPTPTAQQATHGPDERGAYPGRPEETAGGEPARPVEEKFTGQGGLDRESVTPDPDTKGSSDPDTEGRSDPGGSGEHPGGAEPV